jgi:hypothetical protein
MGKRKAIEDMIVLKKQNIDFGAGIDYWRINVIEYGKCIGYFFEENL